MGPSGAGKSTLLDVLAFRKTTGKWTQVRETLKPDYDSRTNPTDSLTQDVRLNGALLTRNTFIKEAGYVTSDDLLPPELTCIEMLRFAAQLRLPKDWSAEAREARVRDHRTTSARMWDDWLTVSLPRFPSFV